jgi:DNA-binding CsgD family transcriptional regulator
VFLAAQVSSLFFLAFFGGSVSRMRAFPSWLFCLCFIIGSVVFVFAGYQEIVAIQMATALGCALMAAGFSWCLLSFWRYLKYYLTIKAVGIILIVGIAVAYTIYLFSEILITDFGRGMLLLATTALLLSATICLNRLENPVPKETRIGSSASDGLMKEYLDTEQNGGGGGYINSKSVAIFIAVISMIPLKGMDTLGFWGYQQLGNIDAPHNLGLMFLGPIICFVIISVPVLYYSSIRVQSSKQNGMQIAFLLLIIGTFVALITQALNSDIMITSAVHMLVGLYSQVLFCFSTALYMKSSRYPAFRICGLVYGASFLITTAWIFLFEDIPNVFKFIFLLVAYTVMIYLLKHEPKTIEVVKTIQPTGPSSDAGGRMARIERLVIEYKLTKRETELLHLLAQGRSVPYIEEELVLSNGTVRTHVRHIYEKMGLHGRQELIDLVNFDDV